MSYRWAAPAFFLFATFPNVSAEEQLVLIAIASQWSSAGRHEVGNMQFWADSAKLSTILRRSEEEISKHLQSLLDARLVTLSHQEKARAVYGISPILPLLFEHHHLQVDLRVSNENLLDDLSTEILEVIAEVTLGFDFAYQMPGALGDLIRNWLDREKSRGFFESD